MCRMRIPVAHVLKYVRMTGLSNIRSTIRTVASINCQRFRLRGIRPSGQGKRNKRTEDGLFCTAHRQMPRDPWFFFEVSLKHPAAARAQVDEMAEDMREWVPEADPDDLQPGSQCRDPVGTAVAVVVLRGG